MTRFPSSLSTRAAALALASTVLLALPLPAQTPDPGGPAAEATFPFPPPLSSPLEPRSRLAPVHVDRGARDRWVGLVNLGERVAFWLRRPPSAGNLSGGRARDPTSAGRRPPRHRAAPRGVVLAGSVAGGAFSRFDLEGNGNEFIEAHFRVGVRLRARIRGIEARAELYHVSSHLGDEFLERTGRSPISTSREGVELLVQGTPLHAIRVYGGPGAVIRSTEDLDAPSLRAGIEWRDAGVRWGPFTPYLSAEGFAWEELDWDPMVSSEAGVAFGDGTFRLALVAGRGPSRAEQFFREAGEALWGLSFSVTR